MKCHYVECHVIVSSDSKGESLNLAKEFGWWGARLGMDTSGEEQRSDIILTTRRETEEEAITAIKYIAFLLLQNRFNVSRGKAEVVVFDSKLGDSIY